VEILSGREHNLCKRRIRLGIVFLRRVDITESGFKNVASKEEQVTYLEKK
jgi:hypothetical protein